MDTEIRWRACPYSSLSGRNKDYGIGANGLAAADSVQAFTTFSFYADLALLDAERAGNFLAHEGDVPGDLRTFDADGRVHVDDGAPPFVQKSFDMAEEMQAACVPPLGTGIREMLADVAERRRAQQCVANGVSEGVSVRVPHGALFKWDYDAAQDELASGLQTMDVVPNAGAKKRLKVEG